MMRTEVIQVAHRTLELRAAQIGAEGMWKFALFENGTKLADLAELTWETASDMIATGFAADPVGFLMDVLSAGVSERLAK